MASRQDNLSSSGLRADHPEVLMIYGVGSSRGRGEGKTTPRSDDVRGSWGKMSFTGGVWAGIPHSTKLV